MLTGHLWVNTLKNIRHYETRDVARLAETKSTVYL